MAVDKTKDIQVGGTLHSIATGNIIAHADEVMDEDYGKKQSVINQELSNRLTEELKGYLPLTGGTMNGNITFPNTQGILIQDKTNTDLLNAGGSTTPISNIVTQVQAAIVDSAPETLDTLNELAAALGDDPNFATTVTNQIANKVDNSKWDNLTASNIVTGIQDFTYTDNSVGFNHQYRNVTGGQFGDVSNNTKTINAATSTTAGVLTAEDFKKLSNITLGENGGISGINFNAGPSDSATFAIETEVDDDATTFVFRLTDNIPVQDKIQFRTSEWYDSGVNHYTPVQITDILESRNPTTNKLERVANISELPSVVTTSTDGLMSAADKTKLDGIDLSNYVNKSGDTISGNLYFQSSIDNRKLCINGDGISVITPTDEDSWATSYFTVRDQEETNLAIGMGALGQQNIVGYFYLGGEYNNATMYIDPNGKRVGIGTSTQSEKLDVNGNVKATKFIGPLQGNADTATKATQDAEGSDIASTYSKLSTTPFAGTGQYDAEHPTLTDWLSSHRSYIGTFKGSDSPEDWTNVISSRHRNGDDDGHAYGMYISNRLLGDGGAKLRWNQQVNGVWQGEKVILDSSNYTDYINPALENLKDTYATKNDLANVAGSATLLGFTESTESNENLEIEATDTINQGFGKLQKAIKDNELVIAEALNSIKDNLGAEDLNAALPDLSTTHYLGSATTFIDCLKALDTKLYEIEQALTLKTV